MEAFIAIDSGGVLDLTGYYNVRDDRFITVTTSTAITANYSYWLADIGEGGGY